MESSTDLASPPARVFSAFPIPKKGKGTNVVIIVILCPQSFIVSVVWTDMQWRKQVSKIGSHMDEITQPGIELGSLDCQAYITINSCRVKTQK